MKSFRILPLLFLFATTSLFAGEVARVTRLNGTARRTLGENRTELKVLDALENNEVIEVKENSVLGLKYTRGETLYFEGPARFRVHAPNDDTAPAVVDLLIGKVNIDGGQGMIDIRTGAGVVSVGNNERGAVEYTPSLSSGTMAAYAIDGNLSLVHDGINSVIPAGKMGVFGVNGSDATIAIPPSTYAQIKSYAAGNFGNLVTSVIPDNKPDLSLLNLRQPAVLSPNGEGAFN